jgi:hypothetical protein
MELEYLCRMEFKYGEGGFTQLTPFGGAEGQGYGIGVGVVKGEQLEGSLRWSNTPRRRSDGVLLPDTDGLIETVDGARIFFSVRGYSLPKNTPTSRILLSSITFATDDFRYSWLNTAFGIQDGDVDLKRALSWHPPSFARANTSKDELRNG